MGSCSKHHKWTLCSKSHFKTICCVLIQCHILVKFSLADKCLSLVFHTLGFIILPSTYTVVSDDNTTCFLVGFGFEIAVETIKNKCIRHRSYASKTTANHSKEKAKEVVQLVCSSRALEMHKVILRTGNCLYSERDYVRFFSPSADYTTMLATAFDLSVKKCL